MEEIRMTDCLFNKGTNKLFFVIKRYTWTPKIFKYKQRNYVRTPIYKGYSERTKVIRKFDKIINPIKFVNEDILKLDLEKRFILSIIGKISIIPEWRKKEIELEKILDLINAAKRRKRNYQNEKKDYWFRKINFNEKPSNFWSCLILAFVTFGFSFIGFNSKKNASLNKKINKENKEWNASHKIKIDQENSLLLEEIALFNKKMDDIISLNWDLYRKVENKEINYLALESEKVKKTVERVKNKTEQLNSLLNEEQRKIFDLAIKGENIFFTGSAGTGKSFLLKKIVQSLELSQKKVAITATTGIAAYNIKGITIHSFSGIGASSDILSSEDLVEKINQQKSREWVNNWKSTDVLIIDEISMLSGRLFDKLEYIARKIRKNHLPFGGLQLILVGDFFQLPPVKSEKLCFEAESWNQVISHAINLIKIYRQKESKLINLLNEIRFGEISDESREILKNLEQEPNFPDDGIKPTILVSTNDEKNTINDLELNKINEESHNFRAEDWEDKNHKGSLKKLIVNSSAVENLELKIGAQVMLIKNLYKDSGSGKELILINGSQGVIKGFSKKNLPIVKFTDGIERTIKEVEWNDEIPFYKTKQAYRIQIPLILSWAITIHKSQGQSIERLKVDLSNIFERGQTYVALSRACSLKYLQVIGFSESKIMCDEKVKKFYRNLLMI